ncbi:sulfatase-like hydrolase/transferase [Roseovarius aestuariivivens]|uniref:sulfatase-like hydrolase/transferase n=1 Tax=Roseovarius aestuariivivens TaxID=1888910 RepID=UPI0010802BC8|nr:sulfatase-like hydrolase/transferase [Roseovarius aestuariivivens]
MKRRIILLSVSAFLVFAVLVLPNHPANMRPDALLLFPWELPAVLGLALAFGRLRGLATTLAIVLLFVIALKGADFAMFLALDRPFNPVLDLFLVKAGVDLLRDSVGGFQAALILGGGATLALLLFVFLRHGLKAWATVELPRRTRLAALAGLIVSVCMIVADTSHDLGYWQANQDPPGTAWTTRLAVERLRKTQVVAADLVQFRQEARDDPMDGVANVLDRLEGRDVLIVWIESYGRASFDNPLYAATHTRTLAEAEARIAQLGLGMKSGWLISPTAGGQSWLAHGALASGLWTSNQGRYTAMLASGHKWLFHFARQAGYRTSAVMPAITQAWPESAAMGFDRFFPAADIPYRGPPFNWVTMPDQFTLAVYEDLLPPDDRPDFIQIALISSHAPWTPVPDLLPWNAVRDGRIFDEMAKTGPSPRDLWKDRDAIRDAYRRAVDYALQAVFSHVVRLGEDAPLVIVAGDHQAAGFVAGSDNRDVPVHMIGPRDLIDLIEAWDWSDGLLPDPEAPVRRMDSFRNDFLRAFSSQLSKSADGS